jgi:hypothetical protein
VKGEGKMQRKESEGRAKAIVKGERKKSKTREKREGEESERRAIGEG